MKYEEIIANAKENLETIFPGLGYTSLDMEGANVVLYSKESYKFLEDPEKIKKLAQSIRKRIIIRPDSSSLVDEKEAEEMIRKILPEDVSISDIFFEHDSGEVIIEVDDPERIQLYNSQISAYPLCQVLQEFPPLIGLSLQELSDHLYGRTLDGWCSHYPRRPFHILSDSRYDLGVV